MPACVSKEQFTCLKCSKLFRDKCKLRRHEKVSHSSDRPFACHICPAAFKYKPNLFRHVKEVHAAANTFSCAQCEKSFKCLDYFQRHLKSQTHITSSKADSNVSDRKEELPVVSKVPSARSSIEEAPRRRIAKKEVVSFSCHHCGQSYTKKTSLKLHISSHCSENALSADNQHSSSKYRLRSYGLNELPFEFECYKCDRVYETEYDFKQHLKRKHVDEEATEKFSCILCEPPKIYKKYYNLRAHMETIHERQAGNTYFCNYCQAQFLYRTNLEFHIQRRHLDQSPELW